MAADKAPPAPAPGAHGAPPPEPKPAVRDESLEGLLRTLVDQIKTSPDWVAANPPTGLSLSDLAKHQAEMQEHARADARDAADDQEREE
jgi:hypothetical protein